MKKIVMIALAGVMVTSIALAQGSGGSGKKTVITSKNTPTVKKDGTARNEKSTAIDTTKKGTSNSNPKTQGKGKNTTTNVSGGNTSGGK